MEAILNIHLYIPEEWYDYTFNQLEEICNGCGSASAKFDFVPDTVWFLSIRQACNIHDFMYHVARPKLEEKRKADEAFLYNMLQIIEHNTKNRLLKWLRRRRVKSYYLAVSYFGGPAFWEGK